MSTGGRLNLFYAPFPVLRRLRKLYYCLCMYENKSEDINEIAAGYASLPDAEKKAAEDKICRLIEPLVSSIINRRVRYGSSRKQDLKAEGILAGLEALRRFDPSLGTKFSTFAFSFISKRISAILQQMSISADSKQHTGRELFAYRKSKKQFAAELKREPTIEELSVYLRRKKITIIQYERLLNKPFSFEDLAVKAADDENEIRFEDAIVDQNEEEWQMSVRDKEFREDLDLFLESLPAQDAEIIRMSLGYGRKRSSFDEIADTMGLSKAAVYRKFRAHVPELTKLIL